MHFYLFQHVLYTHTYLFLVCCVALFLLHSVIKYFDARIKLSFHRPWSSSSFSASGLLLRHVLYTHTYLVSRLLRGVVPSSLCYHILWRPYQALVLSTLIQQQYLCQWLTSSTRFVHTRVLFFHRLPVTANFREEISCEKIFRNCG